MGAGELDWKVSRSSPYNWIRVVCGYFCLSTSTKPEVLSTLTLKINIPDSVRL